MTLRLLFRTVIELQQITLQPVQQAVVINIRKSLDFRGADLGNQRQVIPPLLAHRHQQRITLLFPLLTEQALPVGLRQQWAVLMIGLPVRPALRQQLIQHPAVQLVFFLQITPVITTRIGQQQMHITMLAQRNQRLQIMRRQRRDTKNKQSLRQTG